MNVRRLGVWANLLVSAALALLVWALLVWVASRPGLRALVDLTPQRVNSVDPVTEELLLALRDEGAEVEFHLFRQQIGGRARNEAEQQVLAIRGRLLELTKTLLRRYVAIGWALSFMSPLVLSVVPINVWMRWEEMDAIANDYKATARTHFNVRNIELQAADGCGLATQFA